MWALGIEPRSPGRAASALNCLATSPAPVLLFLMPYLLKNKIAIFFFLKTAPFYVIKSINIYVYGVLHAYICTVFVWYLRRWMAWEPLEL